MRSRPRRGLRRRRSLPIAALLLACGDRDQPVGEIEGARRPPRAEVASLAPGAAKGILFGDLHAHSTYSIDAFIYSLPIFGGEGAHPPADACDFARHCAQLDFFSINDHAEGLTPERWRRTIESIRECNARAGDAADPDLVAFVGYEWTQAGNTPETHFGHKNVIFAGLADAELPWPEKTSSSRWRSGSCRARVSCRSSVAPGGAWIPHARPWGITSASRPCCASFSKRSSGLPAFSRQPAGSSLESTPAGQSGISAMRSIHHRKSA